jgi:hypothetical protein
VKDARRQMSEVRERMTEDRWNKAPIKHLVTFQIKMLLSKKIVLIR